MLPRRATEDSSTIAWSPPFTALMSPSRMAQGPPMPVSGLKPTISTCSLPPSGFRIVLQPKISFSPEATPLTLSARLSFRSGNGCEKSKFLEFLDVIQMSASVLSIIRAQLSMKPRNTPICPAIRITEKLTPTTATANWVLSCKRFLRAMMSTRGLYPVRRDFPTYFLLQYVALPKLRNLPQTVKLTIPQRTRRLRVRDEVTRRMTMTRSLPAQVLLGFALREIGKSACNGEGS